MNKKIKFDILMLIGKLSKIRDWMTRHHVPQGLLFILMGVISTIWFLIRVIPKPSRAGYPCMQVAAPLMSAFVIYMLSLGGITLALRKATKNLKHARYVAAGLFIIVAISGMGLSLTNGINYSFAGIQTQTETKFGPDDGPNQPIGIPAGINLGRVVWAWDPEATNENCTNTFDLQDWFWKSKNTNPEVVGSMFRNTVKKLTGITSIPKSWDLLFKYQNLKKYNRNAGYTAGEKVFIKINQNSSRALLRKDDKNNGYHVPETLKPGEERLK